MNRDDRPTCSLSYAVEKIWKVQLSKHPRLKHVLNSFTRNNIIDCRKEPIENGHGSRMRILVYEDQFNLIYNIAVLQGLFSETNTIKKIIDGEVRSKAAELARAVLVGEQSIIGISLVSFKVESFIKELEGDMDLKSKKLSSPFETLPQFVLSDSISVIQALTARNSVLSVGDTMMDHYFCGDLEKAYLAAKVLQTENPIMQKYKNLIIKEFQSAQEFDDLLDLLK